MNRLSYHVIPKKRGGWDIKRPSDVIIALSHFETQSEAIDAALKLCKETHSVLFIHWPREGIIHSTVYPYN